MTSPFFEDRQLHFGDGCLSLLSGSLEAYTNAFFRWWLRSISQRVDAIIVIGFSNPPSFLKRLFPEAKGCQCLIIDGFSDPLGWHRKRCALDNSIFKFHLSESVISVKDDLGKIIDQTLKKLSSTGQCATVAVAIDSLTPLLRHQSVGDVCHLLNKLNYMKNSEVQLKQAICMLDTDTIGRETVEKLNYYGSVMMQLHKGDASIAEHDLMNIECELIVKKKSGKVQRHEMWYLLTPDWKLQRAANITAKMANAADDSKSVDPTANIPFRLQLSDAEKDARARVNLPYTYNQQRKSEHLTRSVGEGKVFYQPDEVDDFDDEDPDDDLDI